MQQSHIFSELLKFYGIAQTVLEVSERFPVLRNKAFIYWDWGGEIHCYWPFHILRARYQ